MSSEALGRMMNKITVSETDTTWFSVNNKYVLRFTNVLGAVDVSILDMADADTLSPHELVDHNAWGNNGVSIPEGTLYEACKNLYEVRGQQAVIDYCQKIDHLKWAYCVPCESTSPFDEDNTCLVCGSSGGRYKVSLVGGDGMEVEGSSKEFDVPILAEKYALDLTSKSFAPDGWTKQSVVVEYLTT